jgi:uncharacterized repeat protein (TIGR01451 family)
MRRGAWVPLLAAAAVALACSGADDVTRVDIDATGAVAGLLFLDVGGDGEIGPGDTPTPGLQVLLGPGGSGTLRQATTDSLGSFLFENVPVGTYTLSVSAASLGDTLEVGAGTSVTVVQGETATAEVGLTFPILEVEQIAGFPVGRRVVTSGIALNSRLSFGDGRVHIRGATDALRAVGVARLTLSPGDSVRLIGRTAVDGGRAVLEDVSASVLAGLVTIPSPVEVTTATAATAQGGALDAELVRIEDARVLDTLTVGGDVIATVDDGSGPVEVLLQAFQPYPPGLLRPDPVFRVASLTGLLVPFEGTGGPAWRLVPRGLTDISTRVESVDVGLAMTRDFPVASENDTVTFDIAARNFGTATATGVQVLDSLPPGFALIDATPTRGSFDLAANRWDLGDLAAGEADTLRIRSRVTTDLTLVFPHVARVVPLTDELDGNPGNDRALTTVEVRRPEDKITDLRVQIDAPSGDVPRGDEFDITVTASNLGPLKASAIEIEDDLPAGLQLLSATPSRGARDLGTGVWSIDSLAPLPAQSGLATLRLRVRVTAGADSVLTVRAFSRGVQRENDIVPANDTATAVLRIVDAAPAPEMSAGAIPAASSATSPAVSPAAPVSPLRPLRPASRAARTADAPRREGPR